MPEDLEQKPSSKLDSNIPSSMIPPLGITSFPLNEVKNPWKSDVLQDDDYDMI